MRQVVPNYYSDFKCIADKCQYTCCKGWEIDIDEDSYKRYQEMHDAVGEEIRDNIDVNGETASFRLIGDEERCPFLNDNNLCRLIVAKGEDVLCNICKDHPRFRNYREDRVEVGLGLACEEAARLILNYEKPFRLVGDFEMADSVDEDERDIYTGRDEDIRVITDRTMSLDKRVDKLFGMYAYDDIAIDELAGLFLELEILDPKWKELLTEIDADIEISWEDERYEQLIAYMLFRYPDANPVLAISSAILIQAVCKSSALPLEEVVRMFSADVEYSDSNIETLIDVLDCCR